MMTMGFCFMIRDACLVGTALFKIVRRFILQQEVECLCHEYLSSTNCNRSLVLYAVSIQNSKIMRTQTLLPSTVLYVLPAFQAKVPRGFMRIIMGHHIIIG